MATASFRNADLATIHMAGKALFGDVSKKGDGRDAYEDWLEKHTGKRSAGKLSRAERIGLLKIIRRDEIIPERRRGGAGRTVAGADRPTEQQVRKIAALARSIGMGGLDDPALRSFVQRTAQVADLKFMTRTQASKVILGLEEWGRQREAREDVVS